MGAGKGDESAERTVGDDQRLTEGADDPAVVIEAVIDGRIDGFGKKGGDGGIIDLTLQKGGGLRGIIGQIEIFHRSGREVADGDGDGITVSLP